MKMSPKNIIQFLWIFLAVGTTFATSLFIGPVRALIEILRKHHMGPGFESFCMALIILVVFLGTAVVSRWLRSILNRSSSLFEPVLIYFGTTLFFIFSIHLTLNPSHLQTNQGNVSIFNHQFTFGPFPDKEQLQNLREEGYSAVVSLLHPALVPFEPKLIHDEKRWAHEVGIKFINIPMLPWVNENEKSLEILRQLAQDNHGRYYLHCYLGKDRVLYVKRFLETLTPNSTSIQKLEGRSLDNLSAFERGKIYQLEKGVYFTPFPTDEEFMGFILNGKINHVVSLLDPNHPEDNIRLEKERSLLRFSNMPFTNLPISGLNYEPQKILEAAKTVKTMPRPLLVHAFLTKTPRDLGFIKAYELNRAALDDSLFIVPLKNGAIKTIASVAAIGPRPKSNEFGSYFPPKGINKFLFLGPSDNAQAIKDKEILREAGLIWESASTIQPELLRRLHADGPWYFYGPKLEILKKDLETGLAKLNEKSRQETIKVETPQPLKESQPIGQAKTRKWGWPTYKETILWSPFFLLFIILFSGWVWNLENQKKISTALARTIFLLCIGTLALGLYFLYGVGVASLFISWTIICVFVVILRGFNL